MSSKIQELQLKLSRLRSIPEDQRTEEDNVEIEKTIRLLAEEQKNQDQQAPSNLLARASVEAEVDRSARKEKTEQKSLILGR